MMGVRLCIALRERFICQHHHHTLGGGSRGSSACGSAEVLASVPRRGAQVLLDAKELIVLGKSLAAARRTRLDLASAKPDGKVGNVRVLGLARPV